MVCWTSLHWCTARKNLLQQNRAHGYYFSNVCQGMWTHTHTQGLLICSRSRCFRIPKNWCPALGGCASFSFTVIKKTAAWQPAFIRDTTASYGQFGKKKKKIPHLMKTQFVAVFNTTLIMVSCWLASMSLWVATQCNPQSSVEPQNKEMHDKRHPSLAKLKTCLFSLKV